MSHNVHRPRTNDSPITVKDLLPGHPTLPLSLEVTTGDDPLSRDSNLSEAVDRVIPAALRCRHGILVTQRDRGRYTVQVDPGVPCGTIHEKRC
ncbi:hypothetical protein QFZ79_001049 [Arthrobacter sp. V4I6]|uniref:hypothetical protein n=1 Tax=unclassified Arthrobacter TaxID=235627 RepID=UPI002789FD55|nr:MULTISPECIES: hypothetical protein [unclassified Arthrobacter]MDQ0823305.1 hypothetical protein [Arthrobacter sp. V1I7]MDQ0852938.1 hypothetical protein [Arthrobacter sp. V4I6]